MSITAVWPLRSLKTPVLTMIFPFFKPAGDGDEIAALLPQAHELLAQHLAPLVFLVVRDNEYRIAVGGVKNGRGGNGQHLLAGRQADRHIDEHAGPEPLTAVGHGRLDLDVAGIGVHQRIHGRDASFDRRSREGVAGDSYRQAGVQSANLLLGKGEVDIDRVECLQGDDGVPLAEYLAEVDLADTETATEGGADRLLGDGGADVVGLGPCLIVIGEGRIVSRPGR